LIVIKTKYHPSPVASCVNPSGLGAQDVSRDLSKEAENLEKMRRGGDMKAEALLTGRKDLLLCGCAALIRLTGSEGTKDSKSRPPICI